ncbi:MAG: dienelactone hydrolase family protein [Deltaproteobacteria bacterium]|nr:dienelactone hydrolase family protein [Deltaproteobacteria bacterium]
MKRMAAVVVAALFTVSATPGWAALQTQEIEYKQGDTILKGHLAYDDATEDRRPGVLVVHEWWGLNNYAKVRANQLVELGYVALALDMYGNGKNTTDPKEAAELSGAAMKNPEVFKARFLAALDVLRGNPRVDRARVAAIGYCFGGTTVLEMARRGLDLAGVVIFHGGLAPVSPNQPTAIKARILACQGADDPLVPQEIMDAFQDEMRSAKADWQLNIYGGAKHAFTNPDADKMRMDALGYNEPADRRSRLAMNAFLAETFGP